jgi:Protein of unknown function (DUF3455)
MKKNVATKTEDKKNDKVKNDQKTNHSCSSPCLPIRMALAALAVLATISVARASEDNRAPDLPSPLCDRLQVQGGRVAFHVYALGVQIYRWNGASWVFVAPAARLFADPEYHGEVGIHYAGPTWESNSGGKVIASRLEGCAPDPTAIAWLLLQMVSSEGPGIFDGVTHIQRVNTAGGLPPSGPGPFVGAEEEVPYTAEYYFYRAQY